MLKELTIALPYEQVVPAANAHRQAALREASQACLLGLSAFISGYTCFEAPNGDGAARGFWENPKKEIFVDRVFHIISDVDDFISDAELRRTVRALHTYIRDAYVSRGAAQESYYIALHHGRERFDI